MKKLRKNSKDYLRAVEGFCLDAYDYSKKVEFNYHPGLGEYFSGITFSNGDRVWKFTFNHLTFIDCTDAGDSARDTLKLIDVFARWNNIYYKDTIFDAYARPSIHKVASYNNLDYIYKDWDVRKITGYSCMHYTYEARYTFDTDAFTYVLEAKETADNSYLTIYKLNK